MSAPHPKDVPTDLDNCAPYFSITTLEITSDDPTWQFAQINRILRKRAVKIRKGQAKIIADGVAGSALQASDLDWLASETSDLDAFIVRRDRPPSWLKAEGAYIDTSHDLTISLRIGRLIAIQTDLPSLKDAIQQWLDKPPRPPVRRVPQGTLHAALLQGEAKGLWLRGAHARRATKADTKHISGPRLQDALLPHEDSSFALGSARAALPADLDLKALSGTIGTTPRRSSIWGSGTDSISDFLMKARDALLLIEDRLATGVSIDQPYPQLASKEEELLSVRGAFDISLLDPTDLRLAGGSEELVDAAETLHRSIISVVGQDDSCDFVLKVGEKGSVGGELRGRVAEEGGSLTLRFGYPSEPTNEPPVRKALDALRGYGSDILTVYYESGHTIVDRAVWRTDFRASPFPNWRFRSFAEFDITKEKPSRDGTQSIHDAIGKHRDNSLFGWVVQYFSSGWLICDDGPGEIADFVHIASDSDATLSLIHVKGAANTSPSRQIAVGPYEVVASQATKNLQYLSTGLLLDRLKKSSITRPACWVDGLRVDDRTSFLETLACRTARDTNEVVIVQPHVREATYQVAHSDKARTGGSLHNRLRLNLLEALLNSARASVVGLGADLHVIGSKDGRQESGRSPSPSDH